MDLMVEWDQRRKRIFFLSISPSFTFFPFFWMMEMAQPLTSIEEEDEKQKFMQHEQHKQQFSGFRLFWVRR